MANDDPAGLLTGWMASDDLANWDGQGLDDYKVPDTWHELRRGGVRVGRIRMYYGQSGWQIELDGEGEPFTVHAIEDTRGAKQEGGRGSEMKLHVLTKAINVEIPSLESKRRQRRLDPLTSDVWCAGPAVSLGSGKWMFSVVIGGLWFDVHADEEPEIEAA